MVEEGILVRYPTITQLMERDWLLHVPDQARAHRATRHSAVTRMPTALATRISNGDDESRSAIGCESTWGV